MVLEIPFRKHDIRFSVVIPLYNKGEVINSTVKSVLSQTYERFEVIVVDDGSTDRSYDIVKEFDDDRIVLVQQLNQGVASARNTGWSYAKNAFVAFLDADDLWDYDYLETLAQLITDFPGSAAFGTGYRRHTTTGKIYNNRIAPALASRGRCAIDDYFLAAVKGDQPFYTSSVCVRLDVLRSLNGFRPGITHGEDLDLWARIALEYSIAFEPRAKVTYQLNAPNRAMRRPPPLDWIFRQSLTQFRNMHCGTETSQYADACVEHIELYHSSLNLFLVDGKRIREALQLIAWRRHPTRKSKIWFLSFVKPSIGLWMLIQLRKLGRQ